MVTVDVSVSAVLSSEGEGCIIISNYTIIIIYLQSYYNTAIPHCSLCRLSGTGG